MINKIDLVMWTKNGTATLPVVLKRIGEVIPGHYVNRRIVVDDHSSDNTRQIARDFGWEVVFNPGKGIGDGANTALNNVESKYFISFEQDLLLAQDWWQRIPRHLANPKTALASGVRLPNQPLVIRNIQKYTLERHKRRGEEADSFYYGKTVDNTIYKTEVIIDLGGFPPLDGSAGVDSLLAQQIRSNEFEWKVDYNVISTHLRKGLRQELSHYYWYGSSSIRLNPLLFKRSITVGSVVASFIFSPFRGLDIAVKTSDPTAIFVYPLIRFAVLKGVFDGMGRV
ncbi:glycosyltransferase family 2 protein [Candidatus Bathyarchaeota archaeon]|nr:glycosyltransferase family 2 protein [Candidatus Bathyarchaeota archaeon]